MKKNKFTSLVLVATITLMNTSINAFAYNLTGQKWETKNIPYYYEGSSSVANKAYTEAAKLWKSKSHAGFTSNSSNYSVTCNDVSNPDVDWDGYSTWTYYTDSNINYKAVVSLNSAMPAWNDAKALQSVAVHEFGHVLGLAHINGKYIMNPYTYGNESRYETYKLIKPQKDDINGVNSLY